MTIPYNCREQLVNRQDLLETNHNLTNVTNFQVINNYRLVTAYLVL